VNQLILVKIIGFKGFNKLFQEARVGTGFDLDRLLLAMKCEVGFQAAQSSNDLGTQTTNSSSTASHNK